MNRKVGTLDILGQAVDLFITDEEERLTGIMDNEANLGATLVADGKIFLDAQIGMPIMRSVLWHEVKEFIRVYMGWSYKSYSKSHKRFGQAANLEHQAMAANSEWLVGTRLVEAMRVKEKGNA